MTVIRFPVAAKLGEAPMAYRVPWTTRLHRWLFGHRRGKPFWQSAWIDYAHRRR